MHARARMRARCAVESKGDLSGRAVGEAGRGEATVEVVVPDAVVLLQVEPLGRVAQLQQLARGLRHGILQHLVGGAWAVRVPS